MFNHDNFERGSAVGSFGCYQAGPPPCLASALNLGAEDLRNVNSEFRSRANLTWKMTPDILTYLTWPQGFRSGGFNRNSHYSPTLNFKSPLACAPDALTNKEPADRGHKDRLSVWQPGRDCAVIRWVQIKRNYICAMQ